MSCLSTYFVLFDGDDTASEGDRCCEPDYPGRRRRDNRGDCDGQRYRLTWWPASSTMKKAMFDVVTADRRATLQYVTTIFTSQRQESSATLDRDAGLDDIPRALLATIEDDGYTSMEADGA
jgi:hypothetical protein